MKGRSSTGSLLGMEPCEVP
uniref:Uncharacterized protein n=1 Tax=Nymphaea colorata TaxID=210225 RepID=A0A5K0W4M0_9MAGN